MVKKYCNEDEEEWNVLFKMIYSNIVEINDIGKYFREKFERLEGSEAVNLTYIIEKFIIQIFKVGKSIKQSY